MRRNEKNKNDILTYIKQDEKLKGLVELENNVKL